MSKPVRLVLVLALLPWMLVAQAADSSTVTLSLRDVAIEEALAMLAKQQRLNILLSEDVEGSLSLSLYDVPVADAVHAIANAAGFAVEKRHGAYFVMEHEKVGLYSNGGITQVQKFNIHYADPETLEEMLEPYLSRYGKIKSIPESNLLLVSDKPEFLRRISLLVRHADAKPRQVIIEAQILEVSLNNEDSFGIDWAHFFEGGDGEGTVGTQGLSSPGSSGSNGFFFDFLNSDIGIVLTALEQDGRVRTLSTPKLIALDNQEAEVIIGDRRGYQVTTTINQVTSESIEFLESGVILRVTPHIDESGQILMDVHPEVSTGSVDAAGVPSQTTTEVTTSLLVPSGETVFLGGLMKHSVAQGYTRVPILGRVPGLKRLFSNKERSQINTETIVLITPRIVEDLHGDWNSGPVDRVKDVQQGLDANAEALRAILDVESDSERLDQPALIDRPFAREEAPAEIAPVAIAEPSSIDEPAEPADVADMSDAQRPLDELPANFYTVQVMTMSSQKRLDAYVAENRLTGLRTARIERGGELHSALLLGVYESFALAQAALDNDVPPLLHDKSPWIRRLGSLQADMQRAAARDGAPAGELASAD